MSLSRRGSTRRRLAEGRLGRIGKRCSGVAAVAALSSALVMATASVAAAAVPPPPPPSPIANGPQPYPASPGAVPSALPAGPAAGCTTSGNGARQACLTVVPSAPTPAANASAPATQSSRAATAALAPVNPPVACSNAAQLDGQFWGITRLDGCRTTGLIYETFTVSGTGVRTKTGEVKMNLLRYLFGSYDIGAIGYQMMVLPYSGFGPALSASISGTASAASGCFLQTSTASFPAQALSPFDLRYRTGQSFYDTTATAPGSIATCSSQWNLTITNPGFPNVLLGPYNEAQFRCDNATSGRASAGCVLGWFPDFLIYTAAATPGLASHVNQAQLSGLPGRSGGTPLHRTTNVATQNTNRSRACSGAPSIAGKSCDEYPVATSREGLASLPAATWQNFRRTFSGCSFNLPAQTGPTGASSCMIAVGDQNSQGGTNNGFYTSKRVLDGDPFFISVQ
jgi:hypothetical protein